MLASTASAPFVDKGWLFEPKLDGIRAVALLQRRRARLLSRNGHEISNRYPALVLDLGDLDEGGALALDGEIVVLDSSGRPSFQLLQDRMNLTRDEDIRDADRRLPVVFYAFDILYADGYDLRRVPLEQRKALLQCRIARKAHVRTVEWFAGDGVSAYTAAVEFGFEGIVAKKRASAYTEGNRSKSWLKIKATRSADLVVVGYTPGEGRREPTLGALVLGFFDDEGNLRHAGRVGTGFDEKTLRDHMFDLERLRTSRAPFAIPVAGLANVRWVKPELVAEVTYAEVTAGGVLRAPVFVRLRRDKRATEVRAPRETTSRLSHLPTSPHRTQAVPPPTAAALDAVSVIEQVVHAPQRALVDVQGHRLALTNLDRVIWPQMGERRPITKRDLIVYLCEASAAILAHLSERPLTLVRFPNSIEGDRFFQKQYQQALPEFVQTVDVTSSSGVNRKYILANNLPTLVWLGQIGDVELHSTLARANKPVEVVHESGRCTDLPASLEHFQMDYPDFLLFDLDPYIYSGHEPKGAEPEMSDEGFAICRQVALWLKEVLDSLGLKSFVKTSGATGLHVYVPIVPEYDYEAVRGIARQVALYLVNEHPDVLTTQWAVERRRGKVFLDYNQNAHGKTLASPYSPRSQPWATVSTPIEWEEVSHVLPTDFTVLTVPKRLALIGDPWEGITTHEQDLSMSLKGAKR